MLMNSPPDTPCEALKFLSISEIFICDTPFSDNIKVNIIKWINMSKWQSEYLFLYIFGNYLPAAALSDVENWL